jgi:hypothetical protein
MTRIACLRALAGALVLAMATPASRAAACDAAALASASQPPAELLTCARTLLAADAVPTDALYAAVRALTRRDFLTPAADDVQTLKLVLQALDARHAMRPRERRDMLQVLLSNGLVDEAAAFKTAIPSRRDTPYPRVEPLAVPAPGGTVRYWRWDTVDNALREQALDLAHGAHVVVVASAGCHFCAAAATALAQDPALGPAFRAHATWIARPDSSFDRDVVRRWDDAHPQSPIALVFDLAGWPHPQEWSTPTFFFVRDGRVVRTEPGWRPDSVTAMREGLRAIGL